MEIDLSNQRPHITINFENGFDDFFIIHKEVDIESLKFTREEVEEVGETQKHIVKINDLLKNIDDEQVLECEIKFQFCI
ncbi:hypothetical protein [Mammaliicoccus vitulinus]|uniref:hypothetical protein n=1 Tax=Mammaliicoccus vitulinus TaxID=71237 RepID=UPI003B9ECABA